MKVAIANHGIFPDATGGMERHSYNLARSLQDAGVQVDVLVPEPKTDIEYPFPVTHLPWPSRPLWLWSNYEFSRTVGAWIEEMQPDIAFGQGFNLWAYLPRKRVPCIFHPHGLEMFGTHLTYWERIRFMPFRLVVRKLALASDVTISLGGRLTDILTSQAKIPSSCIYVIPNATRADEFQPGQVERIANSLLWVGRLAFNKGLDLLVRALEALPDKQFYLTIVGDGPMKNLVKGIASKDGRLKYLPSVMDTKLRELFQTHEGLLFTSRFEGMPTVILEAMSSGCSIVATDIGAVNTMVDQHVGVLIPPTKAGIVSGIRMFLAQTAEERGRKGEEARKRVIAHFDWPKVALQYLDLFDKLKALSAQA